MKLKWMKSILICLCSASLLTGCWNSRELNDLSIVTGIAIDRVPDSQEYQVTFQIVNPVSTSASMGAGMGQPTIISYSSTDSTLFGALRKTSRKASRQLFFAHTQLVVIGESLAREGLGEIFDIFERSHELRLGTGVLICRDTDAAAVIKILMPTMSIPAVGLLKKAKNTSRLWGENIDVDVFELIRGITGAGDLVISGVGIKGNPVEGRKKSNLEESEVKTLVVMSGLAIFKDGRLQDWLEGPQARGTMWVLDKMKETNINIDSGEVQKSIAVNINHSKTNIKVGIHQGKPVFHIYIAEEGTVNETKSYVDLSSREEILKLEQELAKQTKAEVMGALRTAQKLKSDIFNFGNELERTNPAAWKTVKQDWGQQFAEGELDVQVKAYIRSTGMRMKPYMINPN
ncbi:Ger(x)C family spore germination protein [Paenibacillus donghaensis]|uniref:Uncharacterized protein n=1 Tax=Paenibacillus donghaensis TaxID=414771 RepID=A0A2Z2K425_9BACL|nr:Ger(x)C family spore germination protein [Paenibacillus donghaensis]ASA20396.1 hypothetical protein B9T62_06015 [Paenibacillus donghaensis]